MTDKLKIIYSVYYKNKYYYSGRFRKELIKCSNAKIEKIREAVWRVWIDDINWIHYLDENTIVSPSLREETTKY